MCLNSPRWFFLVALLCVPVIFGAGTSFAQGDDHSEDTAYAALIQPYPDSLCASCFTWNTPQEAFRIYGNAYYVGTQGLSAILITSDEGHVLIDGALPNSAPLIEANIETLGFELADVKLILNSHPHYDHAGGIAALQHLSGARVAAGPKSVPVLKQGACGPDDPQYGLHLDYPAVPNVEQFEPGDTLRVGPLELASHATAGHTPGGTSWSWTSCENGRCLDIVYADSQTPVSADGFRFTDSETYPTAIADFEHGFHTLETIPCDIMIATHPSASPIWNIMRDQIRDTMQPQLADQTGDRVETLVNPEACRQYAARARKQLQNRLYRESVSPEDRDQ